MADPALLLILFATSAFSAPLDVQAIIQRSVAADRLDWSAALQYSYQEREYQGDVVRTYDVTMILGSPYRRLIALDGEPLSPEDQNRQQQLMEHAIAQRRAESKSQRAERAAKFESERKRDRLMMDQLAQAFDFRFSGEEKLGTYDVYVLQATPRRSYRPPNLEAEVLAGMRGTLWIDKTSFQWVKVEAEVVRPVFIAGFLARVEPGTWFELEKAPVADGIWLRSHFAMRSRAKVLFLFTRRQMEDVTFFGYQKADFNQPDDR